MAHPRKFNDKSATIGRLRKLISSLPQAFEKEAWGECTFRVEGGSMFAMTNSSPEHGGREEIWIKADPLEQEILIGASPETFFKPPYVGPKGWIGVRLDKKADWKQVEELLQDGYQLSTPKKLKAAPQAKAKKAAAKKPSRPRASRRP